MNANYGTLYLVPTPIGNLDDMTIRGINVLKSVALIGAEDTRKSAILLNHYHITTPVVSYHKFNEKRRVEQFLRNLQVGKDIAIITDAGTPGISDPAEIIIRAALDAGCPVCTLPGASALLPALVSSGFNCRHFCFIGFLPSQTSEKNELLARIASYPETLIFYESGQRLFKLLELLKQHHGNRKAAIGREISKIFETYYRDSLDNLLAHRENIVLKGEFTVVVEGATLKIASDEDIREYLTRISTSEDTLSGAVSKCVKALSVPKNRVYRIALDMEKEQKE